MKRNLDTGVKVYDNKVKKNQRHTTNEKPRLTSSTSCKRWFTIWWRKLVESILHCSLLYFLFLLFFVQFVHRLLTCFWICLGSENNSLYVYYKGVSKQVLTFKFDTIRSVLVRKFVFFIFRYSICQEASPSSQLIYFHSLKKSINF